MILDLRKDKNKLKKFFYNRYHLQLSTYSLSKDMRDKIRRRWKKQVRGFLLKSGYI